MCIDSLLPGAQSQLSGELRVVPSFPPRLLLLLLLLCCGRCCCCCCGGGSGGHRGGCATLCCRDIRYHLPFWQQYVQLLICTAVRSLPALYEVRTGMYVNISGITRNRYVP